MSSTETPKALGHYIGGRERAGSGEALDVFNPATGKVEKRLACALDAELEEAIEA
ncbi:MAG: methylmalonate-semialdehyde dehydrogenase (CoA acylating), partial [SAR86 cluster bacterium]